MNSHPGHRQYIKMVNDRKMEYVSCKKSAKSKVSIILLPHLWVIWIAWEKAQQHCTPRSKKQIAWSIVRDLRSLDPPARFLQKDVSTGLWNDVGDRKFRVKVSQALREHQPLMKVLLDTAIDDDASAGLHADKRSQTNMSWSINEMETSSEQSLAVSTGQPRLCSTEDRRRVFASSRMESVTALAAENGLEWPLAPAFSISEFTVSDFKLSETPFALFPSSTTDNSDCGENLFPAQQPWNSFPSSRSSISKDQTLEQEDAINGRIEWNMVRAFARPVFVKPEASHDKRGIRDQDRLS